MKHPLALAALASLLAAGTGARAGAAPGVRTTSPAPAGEVTLVAQGCGAFGFRDRFGRCIYRRPPPPPTFPFCPPGTHRTPYGCRRF